MTRKICYWRLGFGGDGTFFKLLLEPVSLHGRLHCEPGRPLPDTDCPHGLPLKLLQLSLSRPCLPLGHAPPEHSSPFQGFGPNASFVSCPQTFPSHRCGKAPLSPGQVGASPSPQPPGALTRPIALHSAPCPAFPACAPIHESPFLGRLPALALQAPGSHREPLQPLPLAFST